MPSTSLTDFRNQFVTRAKARIEAIDLAAADDNALLVAGAMLRSLDAVARFDEAVADAPQLLAAMSATELDAYVATADGREAFERVLASPSALTALANSAPFKTALLGTATMQVLWFANAAAVAACTASPLWAGLVVVKAASLTAPASTTTSRLPAMASAAFAAAFGADTHAASQWQIATDASFANVVKDSGEDATNKLSWLPAGLLAKSTTYYARVRHKGTAGGWGAWSAAVSFATHAVDPFVASLGKSTVNYSEDCVAVVPASDGNLFAVGRIYLDASGGYEKSLVAKWAADGTLLWQKAMSGYSTAQNYDSRAYGAAPTADGGIVVVGNHWQTSYIVKLDAAGNPVWWRDGGNATWPLRAVAVSADGSIYAAGTDWADGDVALIKLTAAGEYVWSKGVASDGILHAVAVAADGSVYGAGRITSNSYHRPFIARWAADGTLLWQKTLEGSSHAVPDRGFAALASAADGSIYAAGDTGYGGTARGLLTKWAADGTLAWQKTFGSGAFIYGLAIAADGALVASGSDGAYNAALSSWSAAGDLNWCKALDAADPGINVGYGVTVSPDGVIYQAMALYRTSASGYRNAGLVAAIGAPSSGALPGMTEQSWIALANATVAAGLHTVVTPAFAATTDSNALGSGGIPAVVVSTGIVVKSAY